MRTRTLPELALAALLAAWTLSFGGINAADAERAAITRDGQAYATWQDYYASDYFIENGKRCGKPQSQIPLVIDPSDCSFSFTNPSSDYDTVDIYEIPVVVHIIEHSNGDGQISDALVHSQMDVLNEDFRALMGTPGANGFDVGINFVLATTDPMGDPTTGITRTVNNSWFNDNGSYWNTLAWDTSKYMNVYTNSAAGNLGYVPDLPQGGLAGDPSDRVVVLWSAFGRNAPGGPPYDQGRTLTHEVGHYLGLEHTFNGGCGTTTVPGCYSTGDLICDTAGESVDTAGCPAGKSSCGSPDPIDNYMDYSNDTCMEMFTDEQSHRMRCSLLNYRADLFTFASTCGDGVIEGNEECDDSDLDDGDGCSGSCSIEECYGCTGEPSSCSPVSDGTACDDANDCTSPDTCTAGSCSGPATPGASCDDGDVCTSPDTCVGSVCNGSFPLTGCINPDVSNKAFFKLQDKTPDTKDKMIWRFIKGTSAQAAFLDPTSNTEYTLCVFDNGGSVTRHAVPSGSLWKSISKGYKYSDSTLANDGIRKILMKEGTGNAKIIVVGKSTGLAMPDLTTIDPPVTVQLTNGTTCWEAVYDNNIKRSDSEQFKAKAD